MRENKPLYKISIIPALKQRKKIIHFFIFFLIASFSQSIYGQLPVRSLEVNIGTNDVSYAGHIIYKGELTDEDLIKFAISDSSLSVADLKCNNANDTIYFITELLNYIQFGKTMNNTFIINEEAVHKLHKSDVERITLLGFYEFWPVKLIISQGDQEDDSLYETEEAEMIYLGKDSNYEYILYSRSDDPITDSFKTELMSEIQNSHLYTNRQLAGELMENENIIMKYFYK
jgi:hypothetical protein